MRVLTVLLFLTALLVGCADLAPILKEVGASVATKMVVGNDRIHEALLTLTAAHQDLAIYLNQVSLKLDELLTQLTAFLPKR